MVETAIKCKNFEVLKRFEKFRPLLKKIWKFGGFMHGRKTSKGGLAAVEDYMLYRSHESSLTKMEDFPEGQASLP